MSDPDKPVVIVTGSSGYIGSAIVKKLAVNYDRFVV
ncbi:NAD(P)-dependent dehydrogenase (short-subunit alcohol dehydrogenase family) [Qipengyuania citrea]|jgi:NAD(P)-dependent dehydrogenase (short-subunit alcohol dehydrogenase family)|nr:NAD(P)-dependent dehydrogenase (short-subunit alcohol dehydrogenase family) [Qipengyuania citrea]|tara:strand:+ start:99775 stop:99882 length:108 start_codon:yes stop_codon:yes gene_type:complete